MARMFNTWIDAPIWPGTTEKFPNGIRCTMVFGMDITISTKWIAIWWNWLAKNLWKIGEKSLIIIFHDKKIQFCYGSVTDAKLPFFE